MFSSQHLRSGNRAKSQPHNYHPTEGSANRISRLRDCQRCLTPSHLEEGGEQEKSEEKENPDNDGNLDPEENEEKNRTERVPVVGLCTVSAEVGPFSGFSIGYREKEADHREQI